jgi:thiamine pyrophosphokinase
MGAFGGRMDQTLAAIHVLTKYSYLSKNHDNLLALMDKNSIMLMLKQGEN